LTPTARGVLRGRRDIGPAARQGLEAFGPSDFVLTTARQDLTGEADMLLTPEMVAANDVAPMPDNVADVARKTAEQTGDQDQIRNLVDRIARFTSARSAPRDVQPDEDYAPEPEPDIGPEIAPRPKAVAVSTHGFAFETDADGMLVWIDQGPRAALIGLALGDIALEGGSGPDGHVAGAFARRSGFRNGRFTIMDGAMAGEWRISASPFFDPASGRFQGYRGQARRPYLHEVAGQPAHMAIAGLSADSLRQLVQELRTPLNAILGFAEIIEQELFGAAGVTYRDMAGKIAMDARHLLAAFDDLDLAARVSRGEPTGAGQLLDPALLVTQVAARFREQAGSGAAPIDIAMAPDLPQVRIDPVQGERMVQHLLRTAISVTGADERVTGACWFQPGGIGGRIMLAIDRPGSLADMEEAQLLDPGFMSDGDWPDGPLLGLGFSLRLIRSLAVTCGGSLDIEPNRFVLTIPAAIPAEDAADLG
jgi:signal transduction histidine kinase